MKLNKIQALVLTLGVALSSGAMFTGKANAAPAASSTASFSGPVAPSCTVETAFVDSEYDVSGTDGPSGGPTSITKTSDPAMFDCNSDTLNISVDESATAPTATNANALIGVHLFTYKLNTVAFDLPNPTAPADPNGDASITVTSTWTGGEDLLEGDYVASSKVTVTAN
jgi:hypothetical protein